MQKDKETIICLNNFYLRYAYNSYDFYLNNLKNNNSNYFDLVKNNYSENLLISSNNLYDFYCNKIISKNMVKSIYKYLLRSSVRSTPYGLNAGIMLGEFNNEYDLTGFENKKKARPDAEWLVGITKLLRDVMGEDLKIIKNDAILIDSFSVVKLWDSCYMQNLNEIGINTQINLTDLVAEIFKITNDYISIKEIIIILQNKYTNYNNDKLYLLIRKLVDNEFLISDFSFSTLINDQLAHTIDTLKKYSKNYKITKELLEIQRLINEYNNIDIGNGITEYLNIKNKMEYLFKCNNYLQIDMYNTKRIYLKPKLKEELEDFVEFLYKWTSYDSYSNYINKFREKYGEQSVKLTDLINLEIGLGIPERDGNNSSKYYEQFLTNLVQLILKDKDHIDLSQIKTENFIEEHNNYSVSAELAFYVQFDGDSYKLIVTPMLGSEQKWKSFGRFAYLFDEKTILNEIIPLNNGYKNVELVFPPKNAHHLNVMTCLSDKKAYLEINTNKKIEGKERISLEDIYVYINKSSELTFVQKSTNDILTFNSMNKYMPDKNPDIFRVIIDIINNQKPALESFMFALSNVLKNISGYIPEIRYKNIIIKPESWKIEENLLFNNHKFIEFNKFQKIISKLLDNDELPCEIYTGPLDQKLILNLKKDIDVSLFYDMLKKDSKMLIHKNIFNLSNLVVSNDKNERFISEFVFQFEQSKFETPIDYKYSPVRIPFVDHKELRMNSSFLSDNWITLKLYINSNLEDRILVNQIKSIVEKLCNEKAITHFFYLRYTDPARHLRIRLKIGDNKNVVLDSIFILVDYLKKNKILNNAIIEGYSPEYNRYGGLACQINFEKVFFVNSIISMYLIDFILHKQISVSKQNLFLLASYKLLKDMNIADEEMLIYLERYNNSNIESVYYNRFKSDLFSYFISEDFEYKIRKDIGVNLMVILDKGKETYFKYWEKIENLYPSNEFDEIIKKRYIINSLLHMFFNRFIGIDRDNEVRLLSVLRKLIYMSLQRKMAYEKR